MDYAFSSAVKGWHTAAKEALRRASLVVTCQNPQALAGGNLLCLDVCLRDGTELLWGGRVLFDRFDSRLRTGSSLHRSLASVMLEDFFDKNVDGGQHFQDIAGHVLKGGLRGFTDFIPASEDDFVNSSIRDVVRHPAREFDVFLGYNWMETWSDGPNLKFVSKSTASHRLICTRTAHDSRSPVIRDPLSNASAAEHACDSIRWALRHKGQSELRREWGMAIWSALTGGTRADFLLGNIERARGCFAWQGPIDAITILQTDEVRAKVVGADLIVSVPDSEMESGLRHAGSSAPLRDITCIWRYASNSDARLAWESACRGVEFRLDRVAEAPLVGMGYKYRYGFKTEFAAAHHLNLPEFERAWSLDFGGGPKTRTSPFDKWIQCWWPARD